MNDLDEILKVAQNAVLLAGKEIRKVMTSSYYSTGDSSSASSTVATTIKSGTMDLVTETDQKCEKLVINLIQQTYPTHRIIGEETSGADCQFELTDAPTWTIDPIDGTTNFVHGLALVCVLVAFLVDKEPVVGVIYDPMAQEMFWAIKGRGAFLKNGVNGVERPIRVSTTTELPQAVVAMDAGYGRDEQAIDRYLNVQKALLLKRVRNIRVIGCCGLALAYVACGRLDANLEEGSWDDNTGPKIWDFAPGMLLVEEAGGVTRDLTGRVSKTNRLNLLQRSVFSAASISLADELLETVYNSSDATSAVVKKRKVDNEG